VLVHGRREEVMSIGQRLSGLVIVILAATLAIVVVILSVQVPRAAAATARGEALSTAEESTPPTITVRANAIVKVQPTTAYFEVGVLTQDKSAAKAQEMADRVIERVMKALQEKGVERKDLATSVCNLRPTYRDPTSRDRRTIIGYHGDNFVTVNARDLSGLGEIIDACIAAGATNIGDVEFRVDDIREYRKQGREMAVRNARERAQQIADAMGVSIVQVKSIEETTSDYPPRRWPWWESRRYSMMSQAVAYVSPETFSEEPEVALGTFPITASVSVAFQIEQ
jgi:uncharacterized protein YggE